MEQKIKAGVIGLGALGQHHLRIFVQLLGAENVFACDSSQDKRKKVAGRHSVVSFTDYRELPADINCVSIVTPTETHSEIASYFILQGKDVFVEKPITNNLEEAGKLLELSRRMNVILQVGHIERFNPAVIGAKKYIKSPRFIEAQRLSPYDARVAATDVVLDMMIHDIDIVLALAGTKVTGIEAFGASLFTAKTDIVKARLKFESGCIADISASRISLDRFRKIRIFQDDSYISLDYMKQDLKVAMKKKSIVSSMDDIEVIFPRLKQGEPLLLEIEEFIDCVRRGKTPEVTAKEGISALEVGLKILESLESKKAG